MPREVIPIFTGGVGRSGTTIVGRILRQHPELFGGAPNEIKFLTETYGLLDLVYGVRRDLPNQTISRRLAINMPLNRSIRYRYKRFRRRILKDWWRRTNRLGVVSGVHRSMQRPVLIGLLDELEKDLDVNLEAAGRKFLFNFIRNHKKFNQQSFWIDTTTTNIIRADELHKLLPEARFIEMRRHPLDNLASVLREPWGPNKLDRSLPWFKARTEAADIARSSVPQELFLRMELEDLVLRHRDDSYKKLLKLIGLTDHQKMREYFESEVRPERAHIGRWLDDFENPAEVKARFESEVHALNSD